MSDSSKKGDVAVFLLTAYLSEAGLTVLQPTCQGLPFDLAVFHAGRFYRLQVKRAQRYKDTGRWNIPFQKTGPAAKGYSLYKYTTEHADFLCGVVVETGDVYCFPLEGSPVKAVIQVDPLQTSKRAAHNRKMDPEMCRNVICLGGTVTSLLRKVNQLGAEPGC